MEPLTLKIAIALLLGGPFLGFLLSGVLGSALRGRSSYLPAVEGAVLAFIGSLLLWMTEGRQELRVAGWIITGNLSISFFVVVDALSRVMATVVSFVSSLIFIYSIGYMAEEEGKPRYFACLALFLFMMLVIVLSGNIVFLFLGWEGVGLCSYLLIGFWFKREAPARAAVKAFWVTRLADCVFLIAVVYLLWSVGSGDINDIESFVRGGGLAGPAFLGLSLSGLVALGLFCGACGKSAQFPLQVWLPDAMEGPTPVSALIHAATMVTAGVYLMVRHSFLLDEPAMQVVAFVGAWTALFAGAGAVAQRRLKRVLAYSTISQLGYMMLAVGCGAFTAAIFHLATHAFFKALLFLCAGSVMHATQTEDMFELGGLRKSMPVTFWCFLIAGLALAGLPFLSGYFSKEEILWRALGAGFMPSGRYVVWTFGIIGSLVTSFYIMRALVLTFLGEPRSAHESPPVMTIPMILLAVFTVVAGYLGIEEKLPELRTLFRFEIFESAKHTSETVAVIAGLLGLGLGLWFYLSRTIRRNILPRFRALARASLEGFFVDSFYYHTVVPFVRGLAVSAELLDRFLVDGILHLLAWIVRGLSGAVGRLQNGDPALYLTIAGVGAGFLLIIFLLV